MICAKSAHGFAKLAKHGDPRADDTAGLGGDGSSCPTHPTAAEAFAFGGGTQRRKGTPLTDRRPD